MKLLKTILFLFLTVNIVEAQICKAYMPNEEGTKLEFASYDKKGKPTGFIKQEITKVESSGTATIFDVVQIITNAKGEEPVENSLSFTCKDNVFYIDMNIFIGNEQMKAYEDMEMEVDMDELDLPADLSPGQKLKDGTITMKIGGDMPIPMNFSIEVNNRKVEAIEDITTPAGTFKCVKLTQQIISKMGFSITINSIDWYAEGIGAVRSETYRKGKLMGSTELTKLIKP